jgi:hypothetical protein
LVSRTWRPNFNSYSFCNLRLNLAKTMSQTNGHAHQELTNDQQFAIILGELKGLRILLSSLTDELKLVRQDITDIKNRMDDLPYNDGRRD